MLKLKKKKTQKTSIKNKTNVVASGRKRKTKINKQASNVVSLTNEEPDSNVKVEDKISSHDKDQDEREKAARKLRFAADEEREAAMQSSPRTRLLDVLASGSYGSCHTLEKEYLRLTALPTAESVRPPDVLKDALRAVKARWLEDNNYEYVSEQLRSIRQDLTVQHLRNPLTVDAYETHARIAIEMNDLAQFRQCQAVLKSLYAEGVQGSEAEFAAYSLLFAQLSGGRGGLCHELLTLAPRLLLAEPVLHALRVCCAARRGDCMALLLLYLDAPHMSPYLMDLLLAKVRRWSLLSLVLACAPLPLSLIFLVEQLGMESEEAVVAYAEQEGMILDTAKLAVDTVLSKKAALALSPTLKVLSPSK